MQGPQDALAADTSGTKAGRVLVAGMDGLAGCDELEDTGDGQGVGHRKIRLTGAPPRHDAHAALGTGDRIIGRGYPNGARG
jgi:hypothetical protein